MDSNLMQCQVSLRQCGFQRRVAWCRECSLMSTYEVTGADKENITVDQIIVDVEKQRSPQYKKYATNCWNRK